MRQNFSSGLESLSDVLPVYPVQALVEPTQDTNRVAANTSTHSVYEHAIPTPTLSLPDRKRASIPAKTSACLGSTRLHFVRNLFTTPGTRYVVLRQVTCGSSNKSFPRFQRLKSRSVSERLITLGYWCSGQDRTSDRNKSVERCLCLIVIFLYFNMGISCAPTFTD